MRLIVLYIFLTIGVSIVFYLSWLPSPDLSQIWFMPAWLGQWTNKHDTMRTGVPFVFLGIMTGAILVKKKRTRISWFYGWLLLIAVVSVAEIGQLFLPRRVFDLKDIAWGGVGSFLGLTLVWVIFNIERVFLARH
jgi:hypothetical protein